MSKIEVRDPSCGEGRLTGSDDESLERVVVLGGL